MNNLVQNNKKGQMAIFVIIAIVVVAGILAYVIVRSNFGAGSVPRELSSVYEYYDSCIKEKARQALDVAGSQGGYVIPPNYVPGSEYAPSSNQLNFLGFPVPYWFYVSANGIMREQVPTRQEIEEQVADYVKEGIGNCNYDLLYQQGFSIEFGNPTVRVSIADDKTTVSVDANVIASKEDVSGSKKVHSVELTSSFGKLYKDALNIYQRQKNQAFLENYSVDILRLYAPVDGVDTSCSAKIWKTQDVVNELQSGLEANIAAIRFKGSEEGADKYFIVDDNLDANVNLIYSRNWPTKIEIYGDGVDQNLIVAEPIGNEAGLGLMGFCYIPYHFVYDLTYPVLVQVYKDNEIFQFPVIVVIDKNVPREAELSNLTNIEGDYDLCKYKDYDIQVGVYDTGLNKIDANISYECLNQKCSLGETREGTFIGGVPGCVNGYIVANAQGYAEKKQLFSSNSETATDLILDREYGEKVTLEIKGKLFEGSALISFENNDSGNVVSVMLPDVNNIRLSEGNYVIKAYVYGNSSITIPESSKTECREVPKGGALALFGATEERCFDITLPSTKIENGLIGGGSTSTYILPSDLQSGKIRIVAESLPTPSSLEQLQYNFESFNDLKLDIKFGQ